MSVSSPMARALGVSVATMHSWLGTSVDTPGRPSISLAPLLIAFFKEIRKLELTSCAWLQAQSVPKTWSRRAFQVLMANSLLLKSSKRRDHSRWTAMST